MRKKKIVDFLFKVLFPQKKSEYEAHKILCRKNIEDIITLENKVEELGKQEEWREKMFFKTPHDAFTRYCLEPLGIKSLSFADVDDDGYPPHYLAGLSEQERKHYVADLESIYTNEKFQKVVSYVINVIGNHAIQKAEEGQMRNGRIGIIGIRTLMGEFLQAHQEYVDSRKPEEKFDPLETLPQ